jgi:hypothetical protein
MLSKKLQISTLAVNFISFIEPKDKRYAKLDS